MMDMELDPRDMDPARRRAVTVRRVYGELWHWKEQVCRIRVYVWCVCVCASGVYMYIYRSSA
jgi:hypothetical protein